VTSYSRSVPSRAGSEAAKCRQAGETSPAGTLRFRARALRRDRRLYTTGLTIIRYDDAQAFIRDYGPYLDQIGEADGKYFELRPDGIPATFEQRSLPVTSLDQPYHQSEGEPVSAITAAGVQKFILPEEYLRAHDGDWEWDTDDSGDRAVLVDSISSEEVFFTGLACAWNLDGSIATYAIYADGTLTGQQVSYHHNRTVERIRHFDGTRLEFSESGSLREIAFICTGTLGASRRFDDTGLVVENSSYEDWSNCLDRAVRRFKTSTMADFLVLPPEYVMTHGQDISRLGLTEPGDEFPGEQRQTGLVFARHPDGSLAGYEFRVNGDPVGRWAHFYPDGTLRKVGGSMGGLDGTCHEFSTSGSLAQVSLWCRGKPVAFRKLDELGQVVAEQTGMTWDTWDAYLDWAAQG